jgi:formylglycine-generating enzyme required for sulfatase activity
MPNLTQRRTSSTAQCYTEPLDGLGDALPLQMVLVRGGTFLMGSPDEDEPERFDNEGPQHEVTIPQFFMGRYPITQAQWKAVAVMSPVERELEEGAFSQDFSSDFSIGQPQTDRGMLEEPSRFKGNDLPVENVSWYDAVEFCARLEKHTKRPYRLPSEAEWEYACRAGSETTTPFHFGETITTEVVNYYGNSTDNDGPKGEFRGKTTSVNHFGIANAFGLSDMHGNVWEWCADHYHQNYNSAPTDGSAWLDKNKLSADYIIRGGSWHDIPGYCRSAYRSAGVAPDFKDAQFGFRVCCSSPRSSL